MLQQGGRHMEAGEGERSKGRELDVDSEVLDVKRQKDKAASGF